MEVPLLTTIGKEKCTLPGSKEDQESNKESDGSASEGEVSKKAFDHLMSSKGVSRPPKGARSKLPSYKVGKRMRESPPNKPPLNKKEKPAGQPSQQ